MSWYACISLITLLFNPQLKTQQVNGEKTNPVPIELTLRSSPYIADAIIFGTGRTQIGALILPSEASQHFLHDEFTRRIASIVALANADAPSHSQLSVETLVFLPYGTVIPRADKGSILRPKVYKEFEKMIKEVYKRLEGELESKDKLRAEGEGKAKVVVREVIGRTIEWPIEGLEDDTDLFNFGLDSLQSTRIRNAIQRVRTFFVSSFDSFFRRGLELTKACLGD